MNSSDTKDVDIFWDFESCAAPTSASGYAVASKVRALALRMGAIKSFRAYLPVSEHNTQSSTTSRSLALRSELQASGVSLIDAPGGRGIADKMLAVDMITHALDHHSPANNVIMLISADPGFAYALSVLRMRHHRVVLLTPGLGEAVEAMAAQAMVCFDWDLEVMRGIPQGRTPWQGSSSGARDDPSMVNPPVPRDVRESDGIGSGQLIDGLLESVTEMKTEIQAAPATRDGREDTPLSTLSTQPPGYTPQFDAVVEPAQASSTVSTQYSFMASSFKLDTPPPNLGEFARSDDDEIVSPPRPQATVLTPIRPGTPTPQPATWAQIASSKDPTTNATGTSVESDNPQTTSSKKTWAQLASYYGTEPDKPKDSSSHSYQPTIDGWYFPTTKKKSGTTTSVPPEFKLLVDILKAQKENGVYKPLWGVVAYELIKADPDIYKTAGVAKFLQYSTLAVEKKIVQVGGESGSQWIRLHPSLKL